MQFLPMKYLLKWNLLKDKVDFVGHVKFDLLNAGTKGQYELLKVADPCFKKRSMIW